jgi:hypothetical protein
MEESGRSRIRLESYPGMSACCQPMRFNLLPSRRMNKSEWAVNQSVKLLKQCKIVQHRRCCWRCFHSGRATDKCFAAHDTTTDELACRQWLDRHRSMPLCWSPPLQARRLRRGTREQAVNAWLRGSIFANQQLLASTKQQENCKSIDKLTAKFAR